jgi:hypothetical protein
MGGKQSTGAEDSFKTDTKLGPFSPPKIKLKRGNCSHVPCVSIINGQALDVAFMDTDFKRFVYENLLSDYFISTIIEAVDEATLFKDLNLFELNNLENRKLTSADIEEKRLFEIFDVDVIPILYSFNITMYSK